MVETHPLLGAIRNCPGAWNTRAGVSWREPMCSNDTAAVESIDLENPRAQRALTECMTVLPEGGDLFTVVGEHGATYTVDVRETGRCTCPDTEYNLEDGEPCKHQIRTLVVTGRLPVPTWVDRDALDELLGAHVDGSPRLIDTDGGEVLTADATNTDAGEDRPGECECTGHERESLPCWYCYAEGFDLPHPDAGED